MKKKFIWSLCILPLCAFTLKDDSIAVWMMGDSTMSIKQAAKHPETGWGVPFATLFKRRVQVNNYAQNGRSTRSFIEEGRWQEVYEQLKEGDYLFIQFGHNDEKLDKPKVGTDIAAYKANLSMFVLKAQEKGAKPILLTPIERRHFSNGLLLDTHQAYPDAVRQIADSLQLPLIDLQKKTHVLLSELGDEKSKELFLHLKPGHKNYPDGVVDDTHLNEQGAAAIAKLVVNGMKELQLDLVKMLKFEGD